MRIMLSLFKGDLKKIRDEPFEVDSKCNFRLIAMFASMIKERFVDDDFLTSKSHIYFYFLLILSLDVH